jgi:putative heme iron utilization protein
MTETTDHGAQARRLVRAHPNGVLSTLSHRLDGAPFGSVAPFILDHAGSPLLLVSGLAEHARNLDADPRCSLLAHPDAEDARLAGRVTLVGSAERAGDKERLAPRYLRHLPDAQQFLALPDFYFIRLRIEAVRFIAGFGQARWIDPAAFAAPPNRLDALEDELLLHLNTERARELRGACLRVHGVRAQHLQLVGIDCDGFDLRADGRALRLDVETPQRDAEDVLHALHQLADGTPAMR